MGPTNRQAKINNQMYIWASDCMQLIGRSDRLAQMNLITAGLLVCILLATSPLASATIHRINVTTSDTFVPGLVYIATGDTVVWANQPGGSSPHNVVSDSQFFTCSEGCFVNASSGADSYIVAGQAGDGNSSTSAWTFNITFTAAGLYPYHCDGLGAAALGHVGRHLRGRGWRSRAGRYPSRPLHRRLQESRGLRRSS